MASLTQNLAGTAQDNTWSYTRNQVQDIKAASWTNNSYQWTGYTNGTRSYTANGLNQYATAAGSTLSYDANGNLGGDGVWTYAYNLDNQLISANKTGSANSLAYDGAGRLRQTTLAGVVTNLSYDGSDLVAEYNSAGALLRRYVHGPGVDEPLVWYEGAVTTAKTWLYNPITCADRMCRRQEAHLSSDQTKRSQVAEPYLRRPISSRSENPDCKQRLNRPAGVSIELPSPITNADGDLTVPRPTARKSPPF